jgi:hypothetical protein
MVRAKTPSVQELTGHKTLQMTMRCSHLSFGCRKTDTKTIVRLTNPRERIGIQLGYQIELTEFWNSRQVRLERAISRPTPHDRFHSLEARNQGLLMPWAC